jgi:hypothetical protein
VIPIPTVPSDSTQTIDFLMPTNSAALKPIPDPSIQRSAVTIMILSSAHPFRALVK